MKKNKGFCWHVHHKILMEYCYDYKGRVDAIKRDKPANEVHIRLQLFKFVKGKLPKRLLKAGKACVEAGKAYKKAGKPYSEAWKAYNEAGKAHNEAEKAYNEAEKAYEKEIDILHKKECPNCPWDGKEIVFNDEVKV